MNALAIIPARGGSKRIPKKNIRAFLGQPIMAYSIQTAFASGLFAEVMVSTEDDEIARVARDYGAAVPFLRSAATAGDHAGIAEVLAEVIACYADRDRRFEWLCCLLPTAPLIRASDLQAGLQKLIAGEFDSVFPVTEFSYPIWRSLRLEEGRVEMNWPENYAKRSQDLPPAYHDCGQFYWLRTERFLAAGRVFTQNSGALILPGTRVQDIDTEDDWLACEMKYQILHQGLVHG